MSEQKSFSDVIREYIFDTHQKDNSYFSTKTSLERNRDFESFIKLNPKLNLDYKKHRALFSQLMMKHKKEINLLENSKSTSSKSEKFTVTKGVQKANVIVNPKNQGQIEIQSNTSQSATPPTTAQPVATATGQATTVQLHPVGCQCPDCKVRRGEYSDIDAEEAGSILEIIIDFWHSRNPKVKPMTPEEVLKVGKRLKPILQRHLNGDLMMYGFGILGVAGVIMDRIDQARGKDDIEKKRDEANKKTSEKKESKPESNPVPKNLIDEENISNRKFFNKSKIKNVEKLGASEDDD